MLAKCDLRRKRQRSLCNNAGTRSGYFDLENKSEEKMLSSWRMLVLVLVLSHLGAGSRVAARQRADSDIEVVRSRSPQCRYAVCLPENYGDGENRPVLFCFDPGGDGRRAVPTFTYAAERYNWIVVGSLDAKNGPWKPILEAQEALLESVLTRYAVEEDCCYATGFSGGARMAYTIAYRHPENFKGVIACGAGFGLGKAIRNIAVYHCVGKKDPTLKEVGKTYRRLKEMGAETDYTVFRGGHQWPPARVVRNAVNWIAQQGCGR